MQIQGSLHYSENPTKKKKKLSNFFFFLSPALLQVAEGTSRTTTKATANILNWQAQHPFFNIYFFWKALITLCKLFRSSPTALIWIFHLQFIYINQSNKHQAANPGICLVSINQSINRSVGRSVGQRRSFVSLIYCPISTSNSDSPALSDVYIRRKHHQKPGPGTPLPSCICPGRCSRHSTCSCSARDIRFPRRFLSWWPSNPMPFAPVESLLACSNMTISSTRSSPLPATPTSKRPAMISSCP